MRQKVICVNPGLKPFLGFETQSRPQWFGARNCHKSQQDSVLILANDGTGREVPKVPEGTVFQRGGGLRGRQVTDEYLYTIIRFEGLLWRVMVFEEFERTPFSKPKFEYFKRCFVRFFDWKRFGICLGSKICDGIGTSVKSGVIAPILVIYFSFTSLNLTIYPIMCHLK